MRRTKSLALESAVRLVCTFGCKISHSSGSERIGVGVSKLMRMSSIVALSYPKEPALLLKFFSKSEILDTSTSL